MRPGNPEEVSGMDAAETAALKKRNPGQDPGIRETWWRWRELNPRPKRISLRYYMLSMPLISHRNCGHTRHSGASLIKVLTSRPQVGI